MSSLFLFDDVINQILAGTITEWIADKENYNQLYKLDMFQHNQLQLICLEQGIPGAIPVIHHKPLCAPYYPYIMLYSKGNTANIRKNVLNEIEYNYLGFHTYEFYHLIKNQVYDALDAKLEKELLFAGNMYYMSDLMTIAVKNKDIQCLKLFLEKGFRLQGRHRKYLRTICGSYMKEQILPLLAAARKKAKHENE